MFGSLWDNKHFSRFKVNSAVTEIDGHVSVENDEYLVRISVAVPDKITLEFDNFEVVIIHLCHNLR